MERERNEILRFQKCSGDRMPPVLFNVWNDVPASKFTIQLKNCKKRWTVPNFETLTVEFTHMTSNTKPSGVQTGSSNGRNEILIIYGVRKS